jgi:hypothetical protein
MPSFSLYAFVQVLAYLKNSFQSNLFCLSSPQPPSDYKNTRAITVLYCSTHSEVQYVHVEFNQMKDYYDTGN